MAFPHGNFIEIESALSLMVDKGHDRLLTGPTFAGVADGATPLLPAWPNSGPFAESALLALRASTREQSGSEAWISAIAMVNHEYGNPGPELSCGVAVAYPCDEMVVVETIGDCGAVIETTSGDLQVLAEQSLSRLDAEAKRLKRAQDIRDRLVENRLSMNKPGSYWCFSGQSSAAEHLARLTLRFDSVASVLLFTDGALKGWTELSTSQAEPERSLFQSCSERGLVSVLRQLRAVDPTPVDTKRVTALDGPDDIALVLCHVQCSQV